MQRTPLLSIYFFIFVFMDMIVFHLIEACLLLFPKVHWRKVIQEICWSVPRRKCCCLCWSSPYTGVQMLLAFCISYNFFYASLFLLLPSDISAMLVFKEELHKGRNHWAYETWWGGYHGLFQGIHQRISEYHLFFFIFYF